MSPPETQNELDSLAQPPGYPPLDRRALIAVDLGAESCRVSLLRWIENVPRVQLVHRFSNWAEERKGSLRWNLKRIIDGVEEGLRQCIALATEGIRSIAVDGWAVDYVRLSPDGEVLADPFCYRDPRCTLAQEAIHNRIPADRLREFTGIQLQAINTVYQLHADKIQGNAARWLNLPEYLLHRWGAAAVAERTNATHTGLVGLNGLWCGEVFKAAELDIEDAPPIVEAGTDVGEYSGEIEALQGVRLIAPCCHDTASAIAGIAASGKDWAYISSGTWSLVGMVLDTPCNDALAAKENFTNLGAAGGRVLFHKGIPGMWLLRQCMLTWNCQDVSLLIEQASHVSPNVANELIDMDDPALALPGNMPARINAQREAKGLPPIHGCAEMVRLIFESLAAEYASVLRSIAAITGKTFREVYIVGGGSQNELLNSLTAKATGMKVLRGAVESATIGNFSVQLAAFDQQPPTAEAIARWAALLQ